MARQTKGTKLEGLATIVRTGSGCVGCMSWETPYMVLEYGGKEYRWQSDSAAGAIQLPRLTSVFLEAFAYGDALRRVRITTDDYIIYGMKL